MKQAPLILLLLTMLACGGPEPRKPVKVKSGSFFTESVERSKRLLAKEEALIHQIIQNDTVNDYFDSANGFWYYLETKSDSSTYRPRVDDEVVLRYNLMTLQNDTLYTAEEVGIVQAKIDKVQLFPGLRNAIKLLGENERGVFLFPSSQAYGYKGDQDKIGPNTPLKSVVELLAIIQNRDTIN